MRYIAPKLIAINDIIVILRQFYFTDYIITVWQYNSILMQVHSFKEHFIFKNKKSLQHICKSWFLMMCLMAASLWLYSELRYLWVCAISRCHVYIYTVGKKASVTDNSLEDPSPAPAAVVVPRLKNWVGWLCFKWDFRLVVLPLFVATVFKQSRHTGSFTLIGSPLSFGLKPKCSHTGAEDCGFETKSIGTCSS